jgi:hypothetical protein
MWPADRRHSQPTSAGPWPGADRGFYGRRSVALSREPRGWPVTVAASSLAPRLRLEGAWAPARGEPWGYHWVWCCR